MKILVITSVYKDNSLGKRANATNIVNSFVHSWVKKGHDVIVIHNSHQFPQVIHRFPPLLKNKIASIKGFPIPDYDAVCRKIYIDSGAKVYRLPIKKLLPHKSPGKRSIEKQVKEIQKILLEHNFQPDIILGHWASPQMEIISELKKIYNNSKTSIVLHGDGYINSPSFQANRYLTNIDKIGVRSKTHAEEVQKILGLKKRPFVCYSGVPDEFLLNQNINLKKFENIEQWKFVYVGRLIKYKNVDVIIKSLAQISNNNWQLSIIGEGDCRADLEKLVNTLKVNDKVDFLGTISRTDVMDILSNAHCFTMVSNNEVFGLVYLEAMAASCITIASKNGGVDGIICSNENGFLSAQGNEQELLDTINKIISLDENELMQLASKGYNTAKLYSDSNVAEMYLQNVLKDID